MMLKFTGTFVLLALFGCGSGSSGQASAAPQAANGDALAALSDEFESSDGLANWKHVHKTEGWNADQLAKFAIEDGRLTLVPHTSTWYQDYRGTLVYKEVKGDFMVTTLVSSTGRDGRSAPRSLYSLGGLMIRTPRRDSAQNWGLGQENYVFLSIGAADQPGNFQFEVKTTTNSQSDLEKIPATGSEAYLRLVKVGAHVVALRRQGSGGWVVHKRYYRADMPATLQVGMTVYTDYPSASQVNARQHNSSVLKSGNPDLISRFDFMRFKTPVLPSGMNLGRASDADIVRALGD